MLSFLVYPLSSAPKPGALVGNVSYCVAPRIRARAEVVKFACSFDTAHRRVLLAAAYPRD